MYAILGVSRLMLLTDRRCSTSSWQNMSAIASPSMSSPAMSSPVISALPFPRHGSRNLPFPIVSTIGLYYSLYYHTNCTSNGHLPTPTTTWYVRIYSWRCRWMWNAWGILRRKCKDLRRGRHTVDHFVFQWLQAVKLDQLNSPRPDNLQQNNPPVSCILAL